MVVVDPGPDDDEHVDRIAALGKIALVLISQSTATTPTRSTSWSTARVPVRSVGSGFLRGLGGPLSDGEVIDAAGLRIKVVATPGHTADSLSFVLDGAVLTADTVLGRGTTVIDNEDGSLRDYLESLRRLHGLGRLAVLPGHGPNLADLEEVTQMYLAHREERLDQVRDALRVLGEDATRPTDRRACLHRRRQKLWPHAEWSVQAQLNYLHAAESPCRISRFGDAALTAVFCSGTSLTVVCLGTSLTPE